MGKLITGIHHVTAMAAGAPKKPGFLCGYTGIENGKEDGEL